MSTRKEVIQYHTLGVFIDCGWEHKEDFPILNQAVETIERILNMKQEYNIFLYPNSPMRDKEGLPIKYGAMVTFLDNILPPCVLIVDNFDDPGRYAIKDKNGTVIYSLNVNRNDLLIANLAEEIFHLNDNHLGRVPKGSSTGGGGEKYNIMNGVPYEIDASLFRVKVLAAINLTKWFPFAKFVDILNKSHQKFSVIWES